MSIATEPGNYDDVVFVYGTLKPDQPGYISISDSVTNSERARLPGYELVERDGLPYAIRCSEAKDRSRKHSTCAVIGCLLRGAGLFDCIKEFESDNYKQETAVVETEAGNAASATVFVQRRATLQRHRPIASGRWSASDDPLLRDGVPVLRAAARELLSDFREVEPPDPSYWEQLWRLQGVYLCLWTVVERFSIYRYGPRSRPSRRIGLLDEDPAVNAAVKELIAKLDLPDVRVFRADSSSNTELSSDGEAPFEAWYQVRSNMVHQGKTPHGPPRDLQLVRDATDSLIAVVGDILPRFVAGLDEAWAASLSSNDRRVNP